MGLAYVEGPRRRPRLRRAGAASWPQAGRPREGRGHRLAPGPPPATPGRWPATTGSSTACAARPASPRPPPSRRPTRRPPPSPPSRCPQGNRVSRDHRRRLGRGDRRRHRPHVARAARPARRPAGPGSTRSCRPAGAATTRSTWPAARPGTRSRGARPHRRPPRGRRRRVPRTRHPGQPGRLDAGGPFYPDHGLERIVDYHERQDARFAEAAAAVSEQPQAGAHRHRAGRHRPGQRRPCDRPGPTGRLCYASATAPSPPSTTSGASPAGARLGAGLSPSLDSPAALLGRSAVRWPSSPDY